MNKTSITELIPSITRKSFYGKANVIEQNGNHYLKSYNTIVGSVDNKGKVHRYWKGKSNTTSTHIISFLNQFSNTIKTTKEFYKLECESEPEIIVTIK